MKALLRSVIDYTATIAPDSSVGGETTHLQHLAHNFVRLRGAVAANRYQWTRSDDQTIWDYVDGYFEINGEVPSAETITRAHPGDSEISERIKDIAAAPLYVRTNFKHLLESEIQSHLDVKAAAALNAAKSIVTRGLEVGAGKEKRTLKGRAAALAYLQEALSGLGDDDADDGIPTVGVDTIFAPLPPVKWLCEGLRLSTLIACPVMLAGYGFAGKTMLAQHLALAVASGKPVFGVHPVTRGRVLHLDYEQGSYLTFERYQRLARGMGIDLADLGDRLRVATFPSAKLDDPATEAKLKRMLRDVDMVIVDSYRAACPSIEENSSEARIPLDMLARVCETQCLALVIHHARKPTKDSVGGPRTTLRGSSGIFDALGGCWIAEGSKKATKMYHEKERLRGTLLPAFNYVIADVPNPADPSDTRWGLSITAADADDEPAREDEQECVTLLGIIASDPGITTTRLRARAKGMSHASVDRVVDHLAQTGHIRIEKGARGANVHTALRDTYEYHPTPGLDVFEADFSLDV